MQRVVETIGNYLDAMIIMFSSMNAEGINSRNQQLGGYEMYILLGFVGFSACLLRIAMLSPRSRFRSALVVKSHGN